MSGVTAIQGVDDILRKLANDAVATLSPKPDITVGPLDAEVEGLRLNWFLYRVSPDVAYRNMEPPQTGGWQTARGNPPLALRLSYLLTAFPDKPSNGGDQEQFAHAGLTAVMKAVHEHAIVGEGSPVLTPTLAALVRPLIEPLRIVLDDLDLESVTKTWTAASHPLRLSVRLPGQRRDRADGRDVPGRAAGADGADRGAAHDGPALRRCDAGPGLAGR